VRKARIKVGDRLDANVEHGNITLTPKSAVERRIEQGLDDLKRGRLYGPYASAATTKKAFDDRTGARQEVSGQQSMVQRSGNRIRLTEEPFLEKPPQITAAVNHANQIDAVFEREVEQENPLEPVGDGEPAKALQLRFPS